MRIVHNFTAGRMIVEWLMKDWETIANLSPGMTWESDIGYFGPIRVSCYDDRPVVEREEIRMIAATPTPKDGCIYLASQTDPCVKWASRSLSIKKF